MALRSPALWMGDPAVQHPASDDRLLLSSLLRGEAGQSASSRPLAAAAGALAGAAGTMGEVTLLSNTQFTVNPCRWGVQAASALGGTYIVTNDALATLSITAQDGTQSRKSYFAVWVQDKFVAGAGDNQPHWGLIDGTLAASNPALPSAGSLPANVLLLGEFLIPPTGQAVTWTPYSPRTGLRGGILPILADGGSQPGHNAYAGAYVDQYRGHPTNGLERWDGTRWADPLPLTAWGDDLLSTTYGWTMTTNIGNPPGMSIRSMPLPPGRTLEVDLIVSQVSLSAAATAFIQLFAWIGATAANPGDSGTYSTSGAGGAAVPAHLNTHYTNTSNADVTVQWSVACAAVAGTVTLYAGSYGIVRLRHRII